MPKAKPTSSAMKKQSKPAEKAEEPAKKRQPPPTLFCLINEAGDSVATHHTMREAFIDRRAFLDCGVTDVKIFRYEPKDECK